jgi:arylsulfatase A-like enzyme
MTLSRRKTIAVGAAAFVGVAVATKALKKPPQRPVAQLPRAKLGQSKNKPLNVLLIVTDQERAWGRYPKGFIEKHAPARAWLMENGVTFVNAQCNTPICSTARGVIYTGAHSPNNEVWDNVPLPYATDMRRDIPTLGSVFTDAGYTTGYSGKWHLSKLDTKLKTPDPELVKRDITSYGFNDHEMTEETDGPLVGFQTDANTVKKALSFIERNEGKDKPWFQAVNLLNPHDIMYYTSGEEMTKTRIIQFPDRSERPPQDAFYQTDLGYELEAHFGPKTFGVRPNAVKEYHQTISGAMGFLDYNNLAHTREMQNYYWNCTRDCDRHLKQLIDGLKASGQLDNTVIMLVSDHGEQLGRHGFRGKGTTPTGDTVNIPFTIVHPEGKKGASTTALVSQVDIMPTLLGLIGIDPAKVRDQLPSMVGRDASALVSNPQVQGPRAKDGMLYHWTSFAFMSSTGLKRFGDSFKLNPAHRAYELFDMLRDNTKNRGLMRGSHNGRYKFARYFNSRYKLHPQTWEELLANTDFELYDTLSDPYEVHNLAATPEAHKEVILAMNALTNKLIQEEIGVDDGKFMPIFAKF